MICGVKIWSIGVYRGNFAKNQTQDNYEKNYNDPFYFIIT